MPIIDVEPTGLGPVAETPRTFSVTPGYDDITRGSDAPERPSWGAAFGAAFRQDNILGALLSSETGPYGEPDPTYNPWPEIKGTKYEPAWKSFADSRNAAQTAALKRQIDWEEADRKLLHDAPWYQSLPTQMIAGVVDLPTLLPGGAFVRGASGAGFSVIRSAATTGAAAGIASGMQEAALQSIQETRPLSESGINVGASVLLGGLLGAGGAKLLTNAEWNRGIQIIERELAGEGAPVPDAGAARAAGAAAVEPTDIAGNTIAGRMAGTVAAATKNLNPALRLLQSPSAAVREIATHLFENPIYLKKNFEGVASQPAAETLMKEWNAGLAKAVQATNDAYPDYRKAGGQMGRDEFRQAVGRAMRRDDEDADPFVSKIAKTWRAEVFDPLKDAAIAAKLLQPGVTVETAASYFSRMWNRGRLVAQEGRFKSIVIDWLTHQAPRWADAFDAETMARSAKLEGEKLLEFQVERRVEREARFGDIAGTAREIADEVFDKLTGRAGNGVRPEFVTVQARGPLKERTFDIPDHLVEEFLEHDVEIVGRRYTRVMSADVEIANRFGSVDMRDQIAKVRDDYNKLRAGVSDERELTRLKKAETADIRDIEALRDLLRGTTNEGPVEQSYGRFARTMNHINYLRVMGEVALASLTETVRPAMVHGLMPYLGTVGHLATNLDGIKMSVAEAKLAGSVAERILGTRLATLSEIVDPYATRGPIEAFLENMTNIASKWNGIRMLTDMQKSLSAVMTQNRILQSTEKFASIRDKERAYLAYLGIDQSMAERIAGEFAKHGETIDGVRVANTESWTDAVAVRSYRAAINKDVDSIITTKGVADVPLFANTPTGRMVLQFKSFFLASHQRVLLRGLQEDQARFIGGTLAMTAIGMMVTYLKAISANRQEKLMDFSANPGWWVAEGLDKAGIFSVPIELANVAEKATGFNAIKTPMKAFDEGSRISQRNQNRNLIGTIVGPTAGLVDDAATVAGIPNQLYKGEEVTKGQKNAATRLVPFNSYFGVRQMLNYVVNPPQD